MLVQGLYLMTTMRVPGLVVRPFQNPVVGFDTVDLMNSALAQIGIEPAMDRHEWSEKLSRESPTVVVHAGGHGPRATL
jgi:hypothetical protein